VRDFAVVASATIGRLGLKGIVSKEIWMRRKVRAIKGVVENQKSEGSRSYSRKRWDVLTQEQRLDRLRWM